MTARLHSPSTDLGFCTDGHPGQILGIAGLLRGFYTELFSSDSICRVWIAVPSARHDFVQARLQHFVPESRLYLLDVETCEEDRYFVQIGLSEIFQRINETDYLLYLDYDHLIIHSTKSILFKHPSSVTVSSEIRAVHHLQSSSYFGHQKDLQTLNTSLIWGRVDQLRSIGERWAECYWELAPLLPKRNLVEYAFGLSALRSGTRIMRCSPKIQGNISNMNMNCIVFHYGGNDDMSIRLKEELYRQGNACLNGFSFIDAVEEADRILRIGILDFERRGASKQEDPYAAGIS
jgi:hypothetical protein